MKTTWQIQSFVVATLALLLLIALLYVFRFPLVVGPFLVLTSICPCVSANCAQCACDNCVFSVLAVALTLLVGAPVLFYFLVYRTRRPR